MRMLRACAPRVGEPHLPNGGGAPSTQGTKLAAHLSLLRKGSCGRSEKLRGEGWLMAVWLRTFTVLLRERAVARASQHLKIMHLELDCRIDPVVSDVHHNRFTRCPGDRERGAQARLRGREGVE
eukprot:scaffold66096_cov63-Phaeocystis_antarctica.AAC.2